MKRPILITIAVIQILVGVFVFIKLSPPNSDFVYRGIYELSYRRFIYALAIGGGVLLICITGSIGIIFKRPWAIKLSILAWILLAIILVLRMIAMSITGLMRF